MDKQEEQKEVSLPGAGGEEPSILEVLNRNLISECDNQVTDQQEQQEKQLQSELHEAKEDHHIDDISHDEINDNVQLDICYAATTQVTDLDADDNDSDKNRVFELESHLIAEDTIAVAHEDCVQAISEFEADTQTPVADKTPSIPSTSKENESVECDIIPFNNSKLSESNSTTYKLGDQRLPVIDSSEKRLPSVEERSNESESSCSDDNSRQTVVAGPTESDEQRAWYQDDDLDPEDQRIIQEAVESILKDAKQQIVRDQEDHSNSGISETITHLNENQPVISASTPLQAPHLILSNPLLQRRINAESPLSIDRSENPDSNNPSLSVPESNLEVPSPDSGVTSPNVESSHSVPQHLAETSINAEPESPVLISDKNLIESSPDSGITSPVEQYSTQGESVNPKIPNLIYINPDRPKDSPEIIENSTVAKEVVLQSTPLEHPQLFEIQTPKECVEPTLTCDDVQQDNLIVPISSEIESKTESLIGTDDLINVESESIAKDTDSTPLPNKIPESKSPLYKTDETTLVNEAKKEYYQRLREYLDNEELNRPPIPLKTYQWEDIRRSRKQGGYPWTHLYKRPLGPDEEPENLTLRKSQERQKLASESPKSVKKVVRIHDEVLVKETERYISELTDDDETEDETDEDDEGEDDRPEDQREADNDGFQHHESECQTADDNFSVQSEPILSVSSDSKTSKINRIKGILKRRLSLKQSKSGSAPESRAEQATPTVQKRRFNGAQRIARCCHPIMNKLKSIADQKFKRRNVKKVPLKDHEKLDLSEKQKILKLKSSPKADHGQIPHFIEKQDSDDVLEILELEESPSKTRKLRQEERSREESSILVPDEIIELPTTSTTTEEFKIPSSSVALSPTDDEPELDFSLQKLDEPSTSTAQKSNLQLDLNVPPERAAVRRAEHIYEDIDSEELEAQIDEILQEAVDSVTRISQQIQEEILKQSPEKEDADDDVELKIVEEYEKDELLDVGEAELKSALKREPSPGSDKRVTFSHTEDEAEPHREDIDLPEEYMKPRRLSNISDHEYEPIGQPLDSVNQPQMDVDKESSPIPTFQISEPSVDAQATGADGEASNDEQNELADMLQDDDEEHVPTVLEQQREIEERYFSSVPTTPRTDSRTDNEIHTSQVDSSALEELPLKAENRKKGFMASAHDRSRKMSENIRSQAGKIRTKIRGAKKAPAEGSPKAKDRKRFKKPDFSKIKMPEMKRPDLSRFKPPEMPKFKSPEFKRPEFTKFDKPIFTKPDLSKFKIPDKVAIKLRRSRSLKETEVPSTNTEATEVTPESAEATPKKRFEFNFGTYPRMLRKRKQQKISTIIIAKADDLPSTESPQSVESTTLPRQEGGPVSPRWTDKFSEVSYGDSESGKYQRYGSEVESLGRESSMERRMKEDLERSAREQEELEIIGSVEQKQFADYDEENRAIHEISRSREGEFKKRRPMVHQDSDLVSEESKDVGWSEKDALRNAMLHGADEQDVDQLQPGNYASEEALGSSVANTNQETQSTGSSGIRQKGVIEEIDDDEFILRKRGISQDNIEIRQYISDAIREGLTTPRNTLAQLADKDSYFADMDVSNEQVNYGYDVPPPKPKRAIKNLNNFDQNRDTESRELSQEYQRERHDSFDDNTSLPHDNERYFSNIPPRRPLRRSRKHFQRDEDHEVPSRDIPYLDDEEDNLLFKKINIDAYKQRQDEEDQDMAPVEQFKPATPPKAPKRRRKQQRDSIEKDSYANRFAGRSVSNSFLPSEERDDDFIVYRTQHEYIIPLAQAETFSTPKPGPRRSRSRSQSNVTDDDRTSREAESLMSESIALEEVKFHIDMKDNDGYATVRKEPPPRPPAPRRHRKSSPLPGHFATMPHLKKESSHDQFHQRHFGTMGPSRPPRRKSSVSIGDSQKNQSSPDVTQYEELDINAENEDFDLENRIESPRGDLHSGDVINKMKFRPLPPPPRPPRETRKKDRKDSKDQFDDKHDKDDGAEMIVCDLHLNGDYDVEKYTEKCIEVEASTQTDPLPDDFCCEEFEITDDMRVIEPRVGRTLQDILREDQHAQPDENFTKSIQRFREAGQRSYSERSRGSTADRSRTSFGSRPTTPSAIVIEKRVPTPIPGAHGETMLEATLVVLPIDDVNVGAAGEELVSDAVRTTHEEDFEKEQDLKSEEEEKSDDYLQEEEPRLITDHLLVEYESVQESAEEQREDPLTRDESPPVAPPRKRSSITTEQLVEPSTQTAVLPTTLELISQSEQQIERNFALPSRLTLTDLEVERLSVHELQAGSITVSQLQSSIVRTDELECRSSNVPQPLEIPPGLIDEIVKRVLSSERASETVQTQTTELPIESPESQVQPGTPETPPPPRPPPPETPTQSSNFTSESMQYSIPPPSFYTLRDPSEAELPQSPTHRRRRHHRRRDSSSDDESYREQRRSRHSTRSPEPTIGQLSGQLLQACGSSVMQSLNQIVGILRANEKEGNDRNISTAIALVIFVTIGFLLLGISGNKNIHHHHWDYFNPPDNKGR